MYRGFNILLQHASNLFGIRKTMATAASPSPAAPSLRFQLPGLNMPLNWVPNIPYSSHTKNTTVEHLTQGDTKDLFPSPLNSADLSYESTS